ncbi:MAG: glycosyltransferase [Candidatus Polarisedimenticolia bacterium]
MKIVFVHQASELGGAERSLLDLMASMRAADPRLDLILLAGSEGPLGREAGRMGVAVRHLPQPRSMARAGDSALSGASRVGGALRAAAILARAAPDLWSQVRKLRKALLDIGPTIVHSNDNKSHMLSALAVGRTMPVVWHVRDFLGARRVTGAALRRVAGRARGAIANSESVGEDARACLGCRVEVVYNGIDTDAFSPGPSEAQLLDAQAGLSIPQAHRLRVGLVGGFGLWKGHALFLEAAARLLAVSPGLAARFYIVGGPIYGTRGSQHSVEDLKRLALELGLGDRVGFVGFQRDIVPIYRSLDVMVHASTSPEPFGRTIVEAMACGRAVIASRAGGAAELIRDGHDALGFAPGDAADLARAMAALASDAGLREKLGSRARESALTRFSRGRLAQDVLAAYERLGVPVSAAQ